MENKHKSRIQFEHGREEKQDSSTLVLPEEARCEIGPDEVCGCRLCCCSETVTTSCGIFQSFATAKWALFLFCMAYMVQHTIVNGLFGVCVSTLEKRFELRSTESGFIASFGDIGQIVGMTILTFFSGNLDKPRWIAWGVIVNGIGSVVFALPHFIAPEHTFVHEDIVNYCGNVTEANCGHSSIRNYRFIFIIGTTMMGIGACPLTYVFTYLDENVKKRNSSFYNSIYLAIGGLGPAIGFVVGGASLERYTDITISPDELTISSSDYLWVGAWWIGFLICGIILLFNAIPLLMLPKYLPGTEKYRKNRNTEAQKSHLKKTDDKSTSGPCQTISALLLLLRNRPYVFMTLGMTLNSALIFGFNTFGAKYIESVFGLTSFHSSLVYGVTAVFACFGAQIISGFIIKKFNLDVPGMLKYTILVGILSALCSIGFLVHCDEIDFAGGTVPYPDSELSISPTSACNKDCGCTTDRYEPICANGTIYFSPCFAGCKFQRNETVRTFANCSCIAMANTSFTDNVASSEFCHSKPCNKIIFFCVASFFCFFSSVLTLPPAIQVTMRCVPFESRDRAMLLQGVIGRAVGIIPGRILAGFVLDYACVAWSTECGEQGSCKAYRRWEIARNNMFLLLTQTVVCAIFYILVFVTYKPAGMEGEGKKDGIATSSTTTNKNKTNDASTNLL